MKRIFTSVIIAASALSFSVTAQAATQKHKVSAEVQADCKAQAAKKFSAVHFIKRRTYTNNCIANHANAKPLAKTKATATQAQPAQDKPTSTSGEKAK